MEFDLWITAADAVVLPYRRSWSSGALARAQALGTPVIVTAVGGLAEQASSRDVVVHDDKGLRAAVEAIVSPRASEVPG
jgi:glycosyltransferase involved in cell wall biosynthesis